MWRMTLLALGLAALLTGCSDPDVSSHRWRCTIDDDCASGHVCRDSVCVSPDTHGGDATGPEEAALPLSGSCLAEG